ncbi:MAG TPA: tetratricopeptide repeat protein [Blastocatellia bacterium]
MRLLIVTNYSAATAHGGADSLLRPTMEEHSLERITALEFALQRAHEQIELLLDLLHRQATTGLYDHAMLDSLVEHLSERGGIDQQRLEALWRKRIADHYRESDERERLEKRSEHMLRSFGGENFDLFARLVDTGADLLLEGNAKRGIRYFEKALVLDPTNSALAYFIGEHFFRTNRPILARAYLERAIESQTDNCLGMLMLGVICGDDGELEAAKRYLGRALKIDGNSFTAHFGLGRILVSEGKLREAMAHLKRALTLKPSAEMYYVVGRAYLEEGRTSVALRHLRRCIEMDPNFDAALYHLGLIYLWQQNFPMAQEHFRAAYQINPRESKYRTALRARKNSHLAPRPVFGRATVTSKKIVTSGDVRLAELLRSDLFESPSAPDQARKGQKR